MNTKAKTATVVLIVILVSCSFVGLVTALRTEPTDPMTRMLQILLGIQPQITNIQNSVNNLDSKVSQLNATSTQIIANYTGAGKFDSSSDWCMLRISVNKPVIYSVSMVVYGLEGSSKMMLDTRVAGAILTVDTFDATTGGSPQGGTFTFPSNGELWIGGSNPPATGWIEVYYVVTVEGSPDTHISVYSAPG